GSDKILSGMRRHYNRQTVIEAVDALREIKEDPFFAADVIAGFPGETDSDFELTMSLLEDCGFSHLHVFPFSPRPDTAALKMEPKVPERISGERTLALRDLSARKYQEYISRWVGREVDVLIEDSSKNPAYGTSENYLKCSVFTNDEQCGAVCRCVIDDITATEIKTSFLYSI
ncbi:MAG: tRNA (N(6)-L-threonylcarbamoyladenosine(37)-C(2))-methylthiotransferase MtaB, partial [Spirochaetales bacterium]|nr:tRNA (N(6)-L-threonylcarbamoyladenosine(37)-C(2))-methylthiotransferase MtaB [Spirochaetales bacterium]